MTSDAEREQDQRRLAAAYRYAASAHNQAAQICDEFAEHYDKHGRLSQTMYERQMAAQERPKAADNPERADEDKPGPHGADLAALLGATITVLLTLTFGQGAWGPLATIIGLLLLVVLLAFFWRRRPGWRLGPPAKQPDDPAKPPDDPAKKRESWLSRLLKHADLYLFLGLSLAVVVGFVGAIAIAQTIQWRVFSDKENRFECRSVAVAQATMAVRDLSDINADTETLGRLVKVTLNRRNADEWTALRNRNNGNTPVLTEDTPAHTAALVYAFVHQYEETVGDCLAGETFESLWPIGASCFVLALGWWYWYPIKDSKARAKVRKISHKVRNIGRHKSDVRKDPG